MIATHADKYLYFSSLGGSRATLIPLAAHIQSSHFLNMDSHCARLLHAQWNFFNWNFLDLEIFLDGYAHLKYFPYETFLLKN